MLEIVLNQALNKPTGNTIYSIDEGPAVVRCSAILISAALSTSPVNRVARDSTGVKLRSAKPFQGITATVIFGEKGSLVE